MSESVLKHEGAPQRLCSEIQLFELCELDRCTFKNGRFCTDPQLLERFEKIAEEELRTPERYISEEEDYEADDGDEFGDRFSEDELDGDAEDEWHEDE
jgi:hypothetical protein